MSINPLDIFVIIALLYSIYQGFTKGLIISIASLIGLVLGVWGALKFSGITAKYLNDTWEIQIPILAFALTFISILLGVYFLGKMLEKVVNILSLGFINKAGGAVFNAVKMLLILGVVFTIINRVNDKYKIYNQSSIHTAYSFQYLEKIENFILPFAEELVTSGTKITDL